MEPVEGFKHRYILDPDGFYPKILKELSDLTGEFDPENPDQYWLEVTHQIAKLDAQVGIKAAGRGRNDVSLVLIIRGGEGYKDRWAQSQYPEGPRLKAILKQTKKDRKAADRVVAGEAREFYKKLRGFFPA